jgi:DNA-binding transcriptional ArsR family regulator
MARSATTLDPFSAIAEPRRRQVMEYLARGECPVNDLVLELGWPQPIVSKHLAVLKQVGLVSVRQAGRQRLYCVNGEGVKSIHNWAGMFEKFWSHQLDRIKEAAERKARERAKIHPTNE